MHDIPLRLIKVLNIICLTIPFAGCWYGYYSGQMKDGFYNRGNLLMIALFMLVYFLFARIYNAFLISVNRISEMVYSQVLAALITDGLRASMLEEQGYRVQVLEFIDMEHTPKNILLRAIKEPEKIRRGDAAGKQEELERCMASLHVTPTLEKLLRGACRKG